MSFAKFGIKGLANLPQKIKHSGKSLSLEHYGCHLMALR